MSFFTFSDCIATFDTCKQQDAMDIINNIMDHNHVSLQHFYTIRHDDT